MTFTDLTTTELAQRLGITRRRALDLLRNNEITGRQLSSGAWLADNDSVTRYELSSKRGSGRRLDPATAWGLLWELSGLKADWLTPSTRARVRKRIRTSSAPEIVSSVASRTTSHRYASANAQQALSGLIKTGRSSVYALDFDLLPDTNRVVGYVRSGSPNDYARSHFMIPSARGHDVIFENTLPISFDGDAMPVAVVAADLTLSTDTRERSAGLHTLSELRNQWLATN